MAHASRRVPLQADLAALRAFVPEFETYLKSDTVFYNVGGNAPALSLGGLLYQLRALPARRKDLAPAEQAELDQLVSQASLLLHAWPVNAEKKALKEISSRLNVWSAGIAELGENYPQAVMQRVYLALLMGLVGRRPEAEKFGQRLASLDSRLRAKLRAADFVLEPSLSGVFPRQDYWFLYGRPGRS